MPYLLVFLSAVVVDSIPVFAPPAWPILAFLLVYFDLNPVAVILLGVTGTSIGRLILCAYIPAICRKLVNHWEEHNLKFLGNRLLHGKASTFVFVFLYSVSQY